MAKAQVGSKITVPFGPFELMGQTGLLIAGLGGHTKKKKKKKRATTKQKLI